MCGEIGTICFCWINRVFASKMGCAERIWALLLTKNEVLKFSRQLRTLVHRLGDTRTVDTFHNCRKLLVTEGERSKIIILCRSTTEMTRECCKTDLLDTSRESHAEFLMRSLFLDNGRWNRTGSRTITFHNPEFSIHSYKKLLTTYYYLSFSNRY